MEGAVLQTLKQLYTREFEVVDGQMVCAERARCVCGQLSTVSTNERIICLKLKQRVLQVHACLAALAFEARLLQLRFPNNADLAKCENDTNS